jgi:hypothetical protein
MASKAANKKGGTLTGKGKATTFWSLGGYISLFHIV